MVDAIGKGLHPLVTELDVPILVAKDGIQLLCWEFEHRLREVDVAVFGDCYVTRYLEFIDRGFAISRNLSGNIAKPWLLALGDIEHGSQSLIGKRDQDPGKAHQ